MSAFLDNNNTELIDLEPQKEKNRRVIIAVVIILLVCILAVTCALVLKLCVISTFVVQGTSMYPTLDGGSGAEQDSDLSNGEILYLNKLAKIRRGDIIVCTPSWKELDGRSIVKRVIGVAGDRVQIIDGLTYVNGNLLDEPYIFEPMLPIEEGEWQVPDGYVFCMGDNRNESLDSRTLGCISLDEVVGRCFLIKGMNGKLRSPK